MIILLVLAALLTNFSLASFAFILLVTKIKSLNSFLWPSVLIGFIVVVIVYNLPGQQVFECVFYAVILFNIGLPILSMVKLFVLRKDYFPLENAELNRQNRLLTILYGLTLLVYFSIMSVFYFNY